MKDARNNPIRQWLRLGSISRAFIAAMRVARRTDGSPLVEFALVLPIMMILITGMASTAIFLSNYIALTNTVDATARTISMTRAMGQTDPCQYAVNMATNSGIGLNTSAITWKIVWTTYNASGTGTSTTYNSSSCSTRTPLANDTVSVSAQYPAILMLYGMGPSNFTVVAQTSEQVQ